VTAHGGHNARVWIAASFILTLFAGLFARLYQIQAMEDRSLVSMARAQHFIRVRRVERRGTVLDCRGRVLATSVQVPSIFAAPAEIDDKEEVARRLAALLSLDPAVILARLEDPLPRVCIKRKLTPEQQERLRTEPAVSYLAHALRISHGALYALPKEIIDPAAAAAALAPLLERDKEDLEADLLGYRNFTWIKRKVSEQERRRVVEAHLEGIGVMPEYERVYPQGSLACQVIGFTGVDEQGLEGIEQAFDDVLAGTPGYVELQRDAAGRHISLPNAPSRPPQKGADMELTLDSVIQGQAEAALREAADLWAPRCGAFAIVLDPRNGDVLAAAGTPSYDPNRYSDYKPDDLKNRARARFIVDWMEPGSIQKVFVFAAALNERVITEQTPIGCENGSWFMPGRPKPLRDVHPYGTLSAAQVIVKSSNIGATKIGQKLGPEALYRYMRAFGFGQLTGFELPGENPGMLRPPSQWTKLSLASICFGQEICVNGLQMALAYGAIANDGVLMRPRLIRRIQRPDGAWAERPPRPVRRVIPASVAQRVRRVLCGVVEEGTGKAARLAGYTVGAKTGSAQKAVNGVYASGATVCSFVAMAPVENPRLVVMVTVDEPTKTAGGRHFGGTVAAPVAAKILQQALPYLGVAPDKPQALQRLGYAEGRERGSL